MWAWLLCLAIFVLGVIMHIRQHMLSSVPKHIHVLPAEVLQQEAQAYTFRLHYLPADIVKYYLTPYTGGGIEVNIVQSGLRAATKYKFCGSYILYLTPDNIGIYHRRQQRDIWTLPRADIIDFTLADLRHIYVLTLSSIYLYSDNSPLQHTDEWVIEEVVVADQRRMLYIAKNPYVNIDYFDGHVVCLARAHKDLYRVHTFDVLNISTKPYMLTYADSLQQVTRKWITIVGDAKVKVYGFSPGTPRIYNYYWIDYKTLAQCGKRMYVNLKHNVLTVNARLGTHKPARTIRGSVLPGTLRLDDNDAVHVLEHGRLWYYYCEETAV